MARTKPGVVGKTAKAWHFERAEFWRARILKGMATYTESEKKVAKLEKEKKEREEDRMYVNIIDELGAVIRSTQVSGVICFKQ